LHRSQVLLECTENVPPTAPVVVNVVVPVAQNAPPLTVAVGLFDIVTCDVAVPVHGAVPKLYVIVYVLAADAPRSITPVADRSQVLLEWLRMYHLWFR
jgi:hypothetical protein